MSISLQIILSNTWTINWWKRSLVPRTVFNHPLKSINGISASRFFFTIINEVSDNNGRKDICKNWRLVANERKSRDFFLAFSLAIVCERMENCWKRRGLNWLIRVNWLPSETGAKVGVMSSKFYSFIVLSSDDEVLRRRENR